MGKQIVFGEESELGLDYESFDNFIESASNSWNFSRITIIASPTKAIVVPCIPASSEEAQNRAGILVTDSTTFKLNDSKTT